MVSVKDMAYSYSRLSLFSQCPYKWYKSYVEKYPEPQRTYFAVGTICHRVAELSALHCTAETFVSKALAYLKISEEFKTCNIKGLKPRKFCEFVFDNKLFMANTKFKSFANLVHNIDSNVSMSDYEIFSMPSRSKYDKFFDIAVAEEKCSNPEIIEEARSISNRFYYWYDFSIFKDELMLSEKKMAFDKNWNKTNFFSKSAWFRGVIDNTIYNGAERSVVVTDYKTSRAMLNEKQVGEDQQLKSYVKMIVQAIGKDAIDSVTVRIVYMRYSKIVSHTFEDIESVVESAQTWVEGMVKEIEELGDDPDKYKPNRNEHCKRCHIREDLSCPIFTKVKIPEGYSIDTMNESSCADAWKRSEYLKDEYQSLQRECKEFINSTDGVVVIDENAILDKHVKATKKYKPVEVVTAALKKGVPLLEILPYLSISDKNFNKLLSVNKISLSDEEKEALFKVGSKSSFDALTKVEIESE